MICLSQWSTMLCVLVYCIGITKKCDMSVTVIYHAMSLSILYQYNSEEWYVCHSDLPCYFSLYTVSVSLRSVICLSQWLIMPCLIVYCISITQKSDISFTVSYHAMSLSMLYQYHSEEWYVCHWFIMLCLIVYCISITQKSDMSITVYHAMSLYRMLYQYHSEDW